MARPEEFWSGLYGAFDPSEVLVGERSHLLYCEREHSPLMYTVPMLIYTLPEFMETTQDCHSYCLPNVKLYHKLKPDQRYENGYNTMHEVVSKRLETVNLKPDELFEPQVLNTLIAKSGGVMRWLIRLVQDACMTADSLQLDKVNSIAAQRAIDNQVAELTLRLTIEGIEELRKVRVSKRTSNNPLCNELAHALFHPRVPR